MKRIVWIVCASFSFLLISGFTCFGETAKIRTAGDTLRIGEAVPFFEMKTSGKELIKSDELKGKVVVMDFWATWCAPCRKLTVQLDSILGKYRSNTHFFMMGVNYREVNLEAANTYWRNHKYTFPMVSDNDVFGKKIGAGNPTILVIDGNGIVRGRWDLLLPQTANEIEAMVKSLLTEMK